MTGGEVTEMDDGRPAVNLQEVRERLMNNDELVKLIIDAFIEDTPKRLASLRESLSAGDAAGATLQSHSIKGAASTVSAERMRRVAAEMEEACRSGEDAEKVMPMLSSLEREFEELKLFVSSLGDQTRSP
jgi:two-component system, sensor histidine kinase and response regulator